MRKAVFVFVVALSLLTSVPAVPALGLSPTACRVMNADTGVTRRNLQAAVRAARKGHRLTVRGVCHGTTTIAKNLTIVGIRPRGAAFPTLDGDQRGPVVSTASRKRIVLKRLKITGGSGTPTLCNAGTDTCGGGIYNRGILTLFSVRVVGNTATRGGGIYVVRGYRRPQGTVTVKGTTRISNNTATEGGGIFNFGMLTVRDFSRITGNTAERGGGVAGAGTAIFKDASGVSGNTATEHGGGIFNGGTVHLYGSSRITGNTAAGDGGGIANEDVLNVLGSSEISGNAAGVEGGGVNSRATLNQLSSKSRITANTAPTGQGGGVFVQGYQHGTFDGSQCGPGQPVHDNIGGDCAP